MAQPPVWLACQRNCWVLALHVQPGARRTAIAGQHGDRLKIAVAAPADAGRANAQVLQFLATQLRVAKSTVELLNGAGSRNKRVAVPATLQLEDIIAALVPTPRKETGP